MLKLKLQYLGHLMWRTDSFEKTLMLERLKAEEGDYRGWNGWLASPTQWTWVWIGFGSWWWTGKPGVLQSMGLQRIGHDWATELTDWRCKMYWFAIYCEMIITIKLINTSIVSNGFCFFVVRTLKIYSISGLQVYKSSIMNYSPHAVQQIPQDLFNLQFVPFGQQSSFSPPPSLWLPPCHSVSMSLHFLEFTFQLYISLLKFGF